MKVLFIHPYPSGAAPSQRFRFEQYIVFLEEKGVDVELAPFWKEDDWSILYQKGHVFQKAFALIKGWLRRFTLMKKLDSFDYVFIHRELDPIGISVLRNALTKISKDKIIFDLDDAIWIPNSSSSNKMIERFKNWNQAQSLAQLSGTISGGNEYLCQWGKQYSPKTICIPTTVDTENVHNQVQCLQSSKLCIGWTGTHSTLKYLNPILPVIQNILENYKHVEFAVICDSKPDFLTENMRWIPWDKNREIEDLMIFHIGLMPLEEDLWAQGKCGFKAIQYMSLGIPAIVSPVGVNVEIVDHGINGLVCKTQEEWKNALVTLIENEEQCIAFGSKARPKIEENYSVKAIKNKWLSMFPSFNLN